MRRIHFSVRSQIFAACCVLFIAATGMAGLAGVVLSAPTVTKSLSNYAQRAGEVSAMETRVAALQSEVAAIRKDSQARAAVLANRQAFLANLLNGSGDPKSLAALLSTDGAAASAVSSDVLAAFKPIDSEQVRMAAKLRATTDSKIAVAASAMKRLGLNPNRLQAGMGGPFEPVVAVTAPQPAQADPQFRALFNSWKRLDQMQQAIGGIPSQKPVQNVSINSGFGVRSDPFRGGAAMHSGVDIPGPYATPIYATADGIVGRAGRAGGYGNLIELEHGRGIQTRYGHLSSMLVAPGTKIKRGQLIGMMGSTGRSTGNHLHYEVRIDGLAVNPIPFLQSSDYLVAMQRRATASTAIGGPAKAE
jgi:murein DD-endopeptidase MepM/ murein hydrolase activator NlpD